MKKLQALFLATVLLVGSVATAATIPTKEKVNPTTEEFKSLLSDSSFIVEADTYAYVTFMLNKEGEVVVLSVDTENEAVEYFVKARLNYHRLITPLEHGIEYKLPVLLKGEA